MEKKLLENLLLVNVFTVACFCKYSLLQVQLSFVIFLTIFCISQASADTCFLVFEIIQTMKEKEKFQGTNL